MPRHGFPPHLRLHNDRDYSRVFQRQQKAPGAHVLVLVRPQQRPAAARAVGNAVGASKPRLGVMVSTKTAPSAVRRHQLKRWVREHFRLQLQHLPQLQGHDLVVLFRRDPPAEGHAQLEHEVTELALRALAAAPRPKPPGPRRR
jgi:ribonuclease P protein component